jgi:4,5-dihydroxyphthalate decarboxylase
MLYRPLRKNNETEDDERPDDRRGNGTAEGQSAIADRFIEEVAGTGTERPRQDEGGPEQEHAGYVGEVIGGGKNRQTSGKNKNAVLIAGAVGHPVAERGSKGLRKCNGQPIERFDLRRTDARDRNRSHRPVPGGKRHHQARKQQRRTAGIADAERAVGKVGHRRACRGGCDDRRPIQPRMEFFRSDLDGGECHKQREKKRGAQQVTPIQGHGDRIATSFAERRCRNLDDPEHKRDFWYFSRVSIGGFDHLVGTGRSRVRGSVKCGDETVRSKRAMSDSVRLKTAIATRGHTAALKDGGVAIDGATLDFVEVTPIIAAFRRMVRHLEFDVCEMAPTTYMIARALGAPYIALPVFVMRHFHHTGLVCRPDSGIREPADLHGRKVGVRAYSVTTGVWTRGILTNEYGLDASKVTWVVDDEEHVSELRLPPNVVHAPPERSLRAMMADGELHAAFTGNAGIGRSGSPQSGWVPAPETPSGYYELFADGAEREAEWYRRTGIYPIHGLIVVKEQRLAENPGLSKALFAGFSEAKRRYLDRLKAGAAGGADDRQYRDWIPLLGGDPLPYGIEDNLASIEALIAYAVQQGLMPQRMPIEKLFVEN